MLFHVVNNVGLDSTRSCCGHGGVRLGWGAKEVTHHVYDVWVNRASGFEVFHFPR